MLKFYIVVELQYVDSVTIHGPMLEAEADRKVLEIQTEIDTRNLSPGYHTVSKRELVVPQLWQVVIVIPGEGANGGEVSIDLGLFTNVKDAEAEAARQELEWRQARGQKGIRGEVHKPIIGVR